MSDTRIHDACRRGDIETVRALIAADPTVVDADDEHNWRPIFHAGLWRHKQIVRLLIEAGADLAAHDGYAMQIEHGADVNDKSERGHTVLYCAGGHGHLDTLQLLLDQGADCDAKFGDDGKTLLQWLAQFPNDARFKPIAAALQRHQKMG